MMNEMEQGALLAGGLRRGDSDSIHKQLIYLLSVCLQFASIELRLRNRILADARRASGAV